MDSVNIYDLNEMVKSYSSTYYEYDTVVLADDAATGELNIPLFKLVISDRAEKGWRLLNVVFNEIGKNSVSVGIGGIGGKLNATVDQVILIFERLKDRTMDNPVKQYRVHNYSLSLPFRMVCCVIKPISEEEALIQFQFCSYKSEVISALKMKVEFQTIFNEQISCGELTFLNMRAQKDIYETECKKIHVTQEILDTITYATVQVTKYREGKEVVTPSGDIHEIELSDERLKDLQYLYGVDVVCEFQEDESSWQCVCGCKNSSGDEHCSLCHRGIRSKEKAIDRGIVKERVFSPNILAQIQQLKSAKEIYNFLLARNVIEDGILHAETLEQINRLAQTERLYGNMKQSCLKVLEKELKE